MQARIRELRMHWDEVGDGDVVLFVHGFPFHGGMWEGQLAELPPGWRGLAPDLRGFGRTQGDDPPAYGMDLFADDLAALLDHVGERRAVVCGLSMGGYVAFALWRRHRERVRGLVLCDTRAEADSQEGRAARERMAESVSADGVGAVAEGLLPKLVSEQTRRTRPDVAERVRGMILSTRAETIARAQRGMAARPDSTPLLADIDVPTLVVVGAEDPITPPESARAMAGAIPDADVEVIPGAAHLPNLERPDAFDAGLRRFLSRLE